MEKINELHKKILILFILAIISVFSLNMASSAATRKVEVITLKRTNGKKDTFIHLRKGKAEEFKDGSKYKYKSGNSSIVKVNKNGELKGVKVGKTNVKIYYKNGKLKQTISVRVFDTSASAVYSRLLSKKKQYPAGMYFTDDYPYSTRTYKLIKSYNGIVLNEYGWPKAYRSNIEAKTKYDTGDTALFGRYHTGCSAFCSLLSDYVYGSIRGSVYYNANKMAPGDIISINGRINYSPYSYEWFSHHQMIITKISGNKVYIADANASDRVRWNVVYTKDQLKKVFVAGLTRN